MMDELKSLREKGIPHDSCGIAIMKNENWVALMMAIGQPKKSLSALNVVIKITPILILQRI